MHHHLIVCLTLLFLWVHYQGPNANKENPSAAPWQKNPPEKGIRVYLILLEKSIDFFGLSKQWKCEYNLTFPIVAPLYKSRPSGSLLRNLKEIEPPFVPFHDGNACN